MQHSSILDVIDDDDPTIDCLEFCIARWDIGYSIFTDLLSIPGTSLGCRHDWNEYSYWKAWGLCAVLGCAHLRTSTDRCSLPSLACCVLSGRDGRLDSGWQAATPCITPAQALSPRLLLIYTKMSLDITAKIDNRYPTDSQLCPSDGPLNQ